MMRKLILLYTGSMYLCATLAFTFPVTAQAAEADAATPSKTTNSKTTKSKSKKLAVAPTKVKKVSVKRKVSSHKIISTIRAEPKFQMEEVNYKRGGVFPNDYQGSGVLQLASSKALIVNQETGETLYAKNTDEQTPIASVTKLMTAMVMLDAQLPMNETLEISDADVDTLKNTTSRLRVGTQLTRAELLQLALMASENRAASALGHNYPGGVAAFVVAMNRKAAELGMTHSHFVDPTGLNSDNVSTAEDLVKMVRAAYQYPQIRQVTTTASYEVPVNGMRNPVNFLNTNILVRNSDWVIGLSKTGFINEAGRCLVMQAQIAGQPVIIVLLDSYGKYSRIGDAQRVRKWIEGSNEQVISRRPLG